MLVDADDLRLDRLRDGGLDHVGAGAGIAGRHLHLRRHDVGKLRDRHRVSATAPASVMTIEMTSDEARAVDEGGGQHR